MMKRLLFLFSLLLSLTTANATITILEQGGWFESGYITWSGDNQNYTVSIRPEGGEYQVIDKELVRKYANYYRADMVGLKAGNYQFKIVGANSESIESDVFYATAHDRSGFAHVGYSQGIGAYKNDGTLKDGARVIYVTANTAKTVKCYVTDGKADLEYTGLQAILKAFEKGKETRPLCIRIIGTVKASDCDAFGSSAEGIQVKGKSGATDMNITIEGIGNDATTHGFGFLVRSACCVEFRNFANMVCMDDCISLDTDNHHVWVHNMDFFYGGTGGDADQAKGDGTVDIKGKSSHITISYNHFYDSGKCSLGGMKGETTDCWMTYHHNWFDHSDSRHPRIRTAFYHCYNNYYDGNSKYGVGVTSGGSAFVEANYFRNTKYPMLSSKQGTDAEGDGTFSGEPGGVNKAFNNVIINPRKVQYYDGSQTDGKWDAVLVANRNDAVTATAFTGGTSYNAAADQAARTQYIENKMDAPEDIPAIVRGDLGAGRLQHGDFKWTFNNSLQDENYDVISDLKQALVNYEGTVVSFADGTAISSRTPKTVTVDGGDGKGLDQDKNDSYVPSWAGGGGAIVSGKQVIGVDGDFFWFNEDNAAQVNTYMSDAAKDGDPSTIMTNGTFNPTREITNSKTGSCSDYKGSILIAQNGHLIIYYKDGISSIAFYTSGNGSQKWQLATSTDGNSFTNSGVAIEAKSSGAHPNVSGTFDPAVKYVRITNLASGGRDIQGVKVFMPVDASDLTQLKTDDIQLVQGQTYTLTAGTDYSTSSTGAITFKSNAAKIASVDEQGKITALTEGTANITLTQAADDNHNAAEIKFTVQVSDSRAASDMALTSPEEITVVKGETAQITATGSNQANFTYTSGAPSIATVDAAGKVTAVAFGTATIVVSDPGTETTKPASKSVTVTVPDNRTASTLTVENDELTVDRNSTVQIVVTKHDGAVTYRSVDEEIATVDENGLVKGLLAGEATIVVSDAGSDAAKAGSLNVTVTVNDTRAESQLAVTSGTNVSIDMAVSKTANITTTGATGTLTYDVDDESIISVSNEGVITAIKGGTTTVTVIDAGNDSFKPGSVVVTVDVTAIPPADPVTWAVNDATTIKSGTTLTNGQTAVFISTDETGLELGYKAGSGCKIDKGTFKMGGTTKNFGKDTGNRYFILPALTGSGTLTITYGSSNANDVAVKDSYSESAKVLATVTKTVTSVRLENLKNTVLYLTAEASKAYFNSITWTPDATSPKDPSTGIQTVTDGKVVTFGIMYDLQGRRITTPVKGQMYIMNGKKYIGK